MNKSLGLCKARGWQGTCQTPCTMATVFASSDSSRGCLDPHSPPHPRVHPESTRAVLARASDAASGVMPDDTAPAFWRGKTLRVRGFVHDGFWVRAHFVMAQGMWASLRRMPFFVHLHGNASCAYGSDVTCSHEAIQTPRRCAETGTCDAYTSAGDWRSQQQSAPGWEEYFEPINRVPLREVYERTPEERIVELQCEAAWAVSSGVMGGSYEQFVTYPETWQSATAYRERNAALVAEWVRPQPSIWAQAEAEWRRLFSDGSRVLGVHLRGTDKYILPKVPPSRYFPMIDDFLAAHPGPSTRIFLATDDSEYQLALVKRYPSRVAQLFEGRVLRAAGRSAIWKDHQAEGAHRKGLEVMLDTLLLSKCDFLLKSASSVSEFAIYFSPRLINASYDFSLPDQPTPEWATSNSAAAPMLLPIDVQLATADATTGSKSSRNGCRMPGRTDLLMGPEEQRAAGCGSASDRESCEALYLSGSMGQSTMPRGFNLPCEWTDGMCRVGAPVPCTTLDEWHGCPPLEHIWKASHSLGSPPSHAERWACSDDAGEGRFTSLGSANAGDVRGVSRREALQMSVDACSSFPWHGADPTWQLHTGFPAIFGLDIEVKESSRLRPNATTLAMAMRSKANRTSPVWTPCTNLAFTMCAARGLLGNGFPRGGRLYLATRGADITGRCSAAKAVRRDALNWDECFITKSEYCTLTRACANGLEVWNHSGHWNCLARPGV